MYSIKSILVIACLAAASYGQGENCMPEGGLCLEGSCCASDNTVCSPATYTCEKASEPEENCMGEGGYCLYGSCCGKDNLVCNPDTTMCEKAPESEASDEALAQ